MFKTKKILAIFSSVAVIATASAGIVACSSSSNPFTEFKSYLNDSNKITLYAFTAQDCPFCNGMITQIFNPLANNDGKGKTQSGQTYLQYLTTHLNNLAPIQGTWNSLNIHIYEYPHVNGSTSSNDGPMLTKLHNESWFKDLVDWQHTSMKDPTAVIGGGGANWQGGIPFWMLIYRGNILFQYIGQPPIGLAKIGYQQAVTYDQYNQIPDLQQKFSSVVVDSVLQSSIYQNIKHN